MCLMYHKLIFTLICNISTHIVLSDDVSKTLQRLLEN